MKLLPCVVTCLLAVSALSQPKVDQWRVIYETPARQIQVQPLIRYYGQKELIDAYQETINAYLIFIDSLSSSPASAIRQLAPKASQFLFAYPFEEKNAIAVSKDFASFFVIDKNYNKVKEITGYEYVGNLKNGFIVARNNLKNFGFILFPENKPLMFVYSDGMPYVLNHSLVTGRHFGRDTYQTRNGKIYGINEKAEALGINSSLIRVKEKTGTGLFDNEGKRILPSVYEEITYIGEGLTIIKKDGKSGLIDEKGKIVIPIEYSSIGFFRKGVATLVKNGKWGLINKERKIILPATYSYINDDRNDNILVVTDTTGKKFSINAAGVRGEAPDYEFDIDYPLGKKVRKHFGYREKKALIDSAGKILIPFLYRDIVPVSNRAYAAQNDSNRWFISDYQGNRLSDKTYAWVNLERNSREPYLLVSDKNMQGIVDKNGKEVVAPLYRKAIWLGKAALVTDSDEKYSVLNEAGTVVSPVKYNRVFNIGEPGIVIFSDKGKYNVFNYEGDFLPCDDCKSVVPYNELAKPYVIIEKKNGNYLICDAKLKPLLPEFQSYAAVNRQTFRILRDGNRESYDELLQKKDETLSKTTNTASKKEFRGNEGLALIYRDKKYGFVNKDSSVIIPFQYELAGNFYNNRAAVKQNGKWGFIDKTGKLIAPCKYDQVKSFCEGMAAYSIDGKWGYLNYYGKEVTKAIYDFANNFNGGFGDVSYKNQGGWVNKKGNDSDLPNQTPVIRMSAVEGQ